jgi:NAD(P)-dependent dehydrogenase (short-subunit alcohol dehydrogenase family)
VTSDESVQAAAPRIRAEAGRLDVLVNNAGIAGSRQPPGQVTADDLRTVYETNVFGVSGSPRRSCRCWRPARHRSS